MKPSVEARPSGLPIEAVDLAAFVRDRCPRGGRVVGQRPLGGGASKDIWLIQVQREDRPEPERYVLRRASHEPSDAALTLEGEFEVMRAAFEGSVPAPEPIAFGRDAQGRPYFIMRHVEGETLAPRLFRQDVFSEARRRLPTQMAQALAAIHRLEPTLRLRRALGAPPPEPPADRALAQYEAAFGRVARDAHPVFELAFRFLRRRPPAPNACRLVHGDFRLGNLIFGPEGLRAVLDWELSHFGDPLEDLAWPSVRAWRFGQDDRPVAGLAGREDFVEAYRQAGGGPVDPDALRWWEIFGNLRWGIITLIQASHYLDGRTRDLEKAVIGRRATEVAAELLNLIA